MLTTATTELIHSVLDGEASEPEVQQLQRMLAAEPAARAEFDAAERLFADFKSVPQHHPPEGLVAAVMAAVAVPAAKSRGAHQLSSRPRVFGLGARDIAASALPNTPRSNRFQSFLRSIDMSQQTRSPFGSRKIWIGSAIAVAAVVGVTQFGLDGKTNEKDVIGTIAPAERYRAPQATVVTVASPTDGKSTPADLAAQGDGANNAANGAAKNAANGAANNAANGAANNAANGAANNAANGAANNAANGAANNAANGAAKNAANGAANNAANGAANSAAKNAANAAANNAANGAAK